MKVVVTGSAGLVGTNCCEFYAAQGHEVIGIDNFMRGKLFGGEGDTKANMEYLTGKYKNIKFSGIDVRDEKVAELLKGADLVIHTAAQPSHPKSIEIPMDDFSINVFGTLQLLEMARKVVRMNL